MKLSYQIAIKLVDHMIKTKEFTFFTPTFDIQLALWLPHQMIDYIKNDNQHEISLYFEVKDNYYYIELITQEEEEDEEDEDATNLKIKVSKQEFIKYLTLLLYYEGDSEDFMLSNADDINYTFHKLKFYANLRLFVFLNNKGRKVQAGNFSSLNTDCT